MIYLIGGPARCGKTQLAKLLRPHVDGQVLSGDALVRALMSVTTAKQYSALFVHTVNPVTDTSLPEQKIDRLRQRDKLMWDFYEQYLQAAVETSDDDILLEGDLWPDYVTKLALPHKAVFMVDTSADHADWLLKIRDSGLENDWMRNFSDKKIAKWAVFNVARSKRTIALCKKHEYRYFDRKDFGGDIASAQNAALVYLLEKL